MGGSRVQQLEPEGDAEDLLASVLKPGERVLWLGTADRPTWRRAVVFGLGCLPFTGFLGVLVVLTGVLGTAVTKQVASTGRVGLDAIFPAVVAALLLLILVYPLVVSELSRRERRYAVTSERALVLEPRRIEVQVDLRRVREVALHQGLFDDSPSGVELRVSEGRAAIVFEDLADPEATRAAVGAAVEASRSPG